MISGLTMLVCADPPTIPLAPPLNHRIFEQRCSQTPACIFDPLFESEFTQIQIVGAPAIEIRHT